MPSSAAYWSTWWTAVNVFHSGVVFRRCLQYLTRCFCSLGPHGCFLTRGLFHTIPHVSTSTPCWPTTTAWSYRPHPGELSTPCSFNWMCPCSLQRVCVWLSPVMCSFGLSPGLHVLVNRAAPSHLRSAPRLSDASVPTQLQASAQQWHQRQRRTIPVHADGGWSYFLMKWSLACVCVWDMKV